MTEIENPEENPETNNEATDNQDAAAETTETTPVEETPSPELSEEATEAAEAQADAVEASAESNTEAAPVEEAVEAAVAVAEPEEDRGAHDDFDWDLGKNSVAVYDESRRAELEEVYDKTLTFINDNEIIQGAVVSITDSDVVLNIGFKSDGMVSLSEFRDMDELKIGDVVDVYVVKTEDAKGQLVLSRKNAKLIKAWDNIVDSYNNETVVTGRITSKTKGGLIVDVFGLETFLPGSQIDVKPILDYDAFVGKKMEFKVVKINEAIKNAVVSHKALIESDLEAQRMEIISKLEKGQVLEGTIKNITDFGAFIDLGGVDGLLYITDISWGRINHPNEVLELNQKLNVVVLDFDDEKKRISLGLKQLQSHPWDVLDDKLEVGSKVNGKIVNIEDYGAFLEITPGVEGLIHVSEVTWSNQPVNSKDFFTLSDNYEAVVMTLNRDERKMSLSIKRLEPDPWEKIAEAYPQGSKHSGRVQNITPYGVFVELEEGIGGMVHISDLSWTKRYGHPSEFTKAGNDLEVVILGIDIEDRKLTLGHKQIEEDPWDTFESIFPVGSIHEGTIIRREDAGGIVQLQYGLEGFAPAKHLRKENGNAAVADETLEFKVIEFDRKDKRIILSHTRIIEDAKAGERREAAKQRGEDQKRTSRGVQKVNKNIERTTLGDLSVLSQLKEQMEEQEKAGKSAPKKAAKKEEPKAEEVEAEEPKAEEAVAETPVEEAKAEAATETTEAPAEEATTEAPAEETATEEAPEAETPAEEEPKTEEVEEDAAAEEEAKADDATEEEEKKKEE